MIYKIDNTELKQYIELIEPASKGQIDSVARHRADFGGIVFNCFWYDKMKDEYRTILLSSMTDVMDQTNTDSSAVRIDTWLKTINSRMHSIE